jgi:hypothetical protein
MARDISMHVKLTIQATAITIASVFEASSQRNMHSTAVPVAQSTATHAKIIGAGYFVL